MAVARSHDSIKSRVINLVIDWSLSYAHTFAAGRSVGTRPLWWKRKRCRSITCFAEPFPVHSYPLRSPTRGTRWTAPIIVDRMGVTLVFVYFSGPISRVVYFLFCWWSNYPPLESYVSDSEEYAVRNLLYSNEIQVNLCCGVVSILSIVIQWMWVITRENNNNQS